MNKFEFKKNNVNVNIIKALDDIKMINFNCPFPIEFELKKHYESAIQTNDEKTSEYLSYLNNPKELTDYELLEIPEFRNAFILFLEKTSNSLNNSYL